MNIQNIPLTDIHPYARNPRKNDEAVKSVAASIREFGFLVPLVIDAGHEIVAGHTRYRAAQSLGMKEVPCVVADELSDAQIKAFRLADNKVGELASWGMDLSLIHILCGIQPFGNRTALVLLWRYAGQGQQKQCDGCGNVRGYTILHHDGKARQWLS